MNAETLNYVASIKPQLFSTNILDSFLMYILMVVYEWMYNVYPNVYPDDH